MLGLEQAILSPGQNSGNYFAPIPLEDHAETKVDILEMLQKAKVEIYPNRLGKFVLHWLLYFPLLSCIVRVSFEYFCIKFPFDEMNYFIESK